MTTQQLSAFAQKNLDAKHEKILKELTRVNANRRCADCDNMVRKHVAKSHGRSLALALPLHPLTPRLCTMQGPQYVITTFGVFVCTGCGGLQ